MLNLKMLTSVTAVLLATLLLAGCGTTPDGPAANAGAETDVTENAVAETSATPMLSTAEQTLADCVIDSQMEFRKYVHEHRRRININITRSSISYADLNCRHLAPK